MPYSANDAQSKRRGSSLVLVHSGIPRNNISRRIVSAPLVSPPCLVIALFPRLWSSVYPSVPASKLSATCVSPIRDSDPSQPFATGHSLCSINIGNMEDNLDVRLLHRALGGRRLRQSIKRFYGDRSWAEDLDIVNELGGHTGCVNALRYGYLRLPRNCELTTIAGLAVVLSSPQAPMTPISTFGITIRLI